MSEQKREPYWWERKGTAKTPSPWAGYASRVATKKTPSPWAGYASRGIATKSATGAQPTTQPAETYWWGELKPTQDVYGTQTDIFSSHLQEFYQQNRGDETYLGFLKAKYPDDSEQLTGDFISAVKQAQPELLGTQADYFKVHPINKDVFGRLTNLDVKTINFIFKLLEYGFYPFTAVGMAQWAGMKVEPEVAGKVTPKAEMPEFKMVEGKLVGVPEAEGFNIKDWLPGGKRYKEYQSLPLEKQLFYEAPAYALALLLPSATTLSTALKPIIEAGGIAGKTATVGRVALAPLVGYEALIGKAVGGITNKVLSLAQQQAIKIALRREATRVGVKLSSEAEKALISAYKTAFGQHLNRELVTWMAKNPGVELSDEFQERVIKHLMTRVSPRWSAGMMMDALEGTITPAMITASADKTAAEVASMLPMVLSEAITPPATAGAAGIMPITGAIAGEAVTGALPAITETVTGAIPPNIEFKPITTNVGKGYDILQNNLPIGSISYGTTDILGIEGVIIGRIDISEVARRQGLATQAIQKVLDEAETAGVPLYTGMLEPDGVKLFNALEERGVISLTPAKERMLGNIVTRGVPEYARTTAMAGGETVSPKGEIPPPEVKPGIVRRADIIKELSDKLNVPIRRGHFRGKAIGIYKKGKEIIRLKKGEVETTSHEVGHLLDDRYELSSHIPQNELPALLKEYTGKPKRKHAEAFAEFVRYYVTNPKNLKSIAPKFYEYFTKDFLANNPDIQNILDAARDDYARWRNMPATAKIASQLSLQEPEKFNLRQKLSDLYTAAWDDLYPIRDFVKTAERLGVEVAATENPYMLARLLRGKHGRVHVFLEEGTFGKKFWKETRGKAVPDFTGKSLKQILAPLEAKGQLDDFRIYLVARRAYRLADRGIETGIAKGDAKTAITELGTKYPSFKDTATEVYKFQASVWQYAYESGLITTETKAKLTRIDTDYVPFYRIVEELQTRGYMGKTLANVRAPVHKIKGSERLIIDPLESIVKNTYATMDAADRNQVGIMLARLAGKDKILTQLFEAIPSPISKVAQVDAKELGIKFPELADKDVDKIIDIFRPSLFYGGDDTLSVLINGQKKFFQVDHDLYKAVMSIEREQAGLIVRLLSYPAKWLRAGAVLSPDFWMLKNPLRDTMTAFAYSKYGFMPVIDTLRGLFEFLGKGEAYKMWRMSGGEHAMLVSMDRQYLRKSFKDVVKGRELVDYIKHPLETLEIFAEFTEAATRLGEFKRAISKGATPVEAGFASREVSLDFATIGAQTKSMNMITAFWNANMRAIDKLVRHATQPKLAKRFWPKVLLGITLPSILLYFANKDDPRWEEIPQWQKDLFWIIFTPDHIYRIPKPFELGILFGSLPERVLEYLESQDDESIKEVFRNAGSSINPGFIPTALLPIIESMTNYNFFLGRQIVPESLEDMPPQLQYTVYTPEIIKEFGEWVNYSPLKIQSLLRGYTAGLGVYVTDALNSILMGTGVLPDIPKPSPTLADYPVIRAIVIRDPYGSDSASVGDFYDTLDELIKGERYLEEMLNKGEISKFNKYKIAHPEIMLVFDYGSGETYSASRKFLTQQSQILSDLRTKQREIYSSLTMTSDEKRTRIDELNHLITHTARLALDHLGAMPDEFSSEGLVEPKPEKAGLYAVMEKLPKALRDYLWENRRTIGSEQWAIWEDKVEEWRETDESLIDTYYEETKGQSPNDKYSYRKSHPKTDVALNFWGYVTTIQSSTAKGLLQKRAKELGIPSLWGETEPKYWWEGASERKTVSPWAGAAERKTESPWAGASEGKTESPWAGAAGEESEYWGETGATSEGQPRIVPMGFGGLPETEPMVSGKYTPTAEMPTFPEGTFPKTEEGASLESLLDSFRKAKSENEKVEFLDIAVGLYGQKEVKASLTSEELTKYNWDIRASDWARYGILAHFIHWGNEFWKVFGWIVERADPEQLKRVTANVPEFQEIVIDTLLPIYKTEKEGFPEKTWQALLKLAVERYGVEELIRKVEEIGIPNQWDKIKQEIMNINK